VRVERLDPLADPRWQRLVDAASGPTVFAHPAWLELIGGHYRYGMTAHAVLDDDGELVLGLPLARIQSRLTGRRLVALPFTDACPPVRRRDAAEDAGADAALMRALAAERRESGLDMEIRAPLPELPGVHVASRFLTHRLALEPEADAVLARASKSQIRRGIKKAVREGVTTRVRTDRAALEEFYALHLRTRRRQGVPIQPKRFILGFERLFARGLGQVVTSHHDGRTLSAAVFLNHGDTVVYKYGASDERFLALRPNNLLFADAIRAACAAGYSTLDFGRTDTDNEGLAAFKRSWGAEEEPLSYTSLAERPRPQESNGLAHRALAELIRRGPVRTGQVIGTALYRHVG
jgi:CelD/BcsL family acetyltransferase involved in cellulose biosynthesis